MTDGEILTYLIAAAKSLEPVDGTEYARGVCELIGRYACDYGDMGEQGTEDIARTMREIVCVPAPSKD